MKTTFFLLLGLSLLFTSCSSRRGGPMQRVGRGVDNTVDWVGYGVRRTGESIQRATR